MKTLQEKFRIRIDQGLRKWRRLDQQEPVKIGFGEFDRGLFVHRQRRCDVQRNQLLDALRMIKRQTIADAPAAIVADQKEILMAQRAHHVDLVLRHHAFGIVAVVRQPFRLVAVAVPAQIRRDHSETGRQLFGDLVPDRVGLWVAVQQQQRRARAAPHEGDL
jgi:hypothetical protein